MALFWAMPGLIFALILLDQRLLCLQRQMDGEVRQIQKERLVLVRSMNRIASSVSRSVRYSPLGPSVSVGNIVRREVVLRVRQVGAADVDVEAVLLRIIFLAAEVPLADAGRGVSALLRARERS